ncbi:uncharacterized protein VTP21DRAFT_3504 [Calcarisporiella thermophila]|uniref:uncharacterized protein n=1 Tax=Calcarisporiella thermophila TaxID=911321 RepID=UPI00374404DF
MNDIPLAAQSDAEPKLNWITFIATSQWIATLITLVVLLLATTVYYRQLYNEQRERWLASVRNNSTPKTTVEYLNCLLTSPHTTKKLLKTDLFSKVYSVTIKDQFKITVKKVKPYSFIVNLVHRGIIRNFWWFIKANTRNPHIAESVEEVRLSASAYFQVCRHHTRCLGLHVIVSKAFKTFVDKSDPNLLPKEEFESALKLLKIVGYFHTKNIPLIDMKWEDIDFLENLCEIASVIPDELYRISVIIFPDDTLLYELDHRGPLKSVHHKARYHIEEVYLRAINRYRKLKSTLNEHLRFTSDEIDIDRRPGASTTSLDEERADAQAEYKRQRFEQDRIVALKLTEVLQRQSGMDVQNSLRNPTLIVASAFLKRVDKQELKEVYEVLSKEVLAGKLGIHSDVFDDNRGFREFASKNSLHRYLFVYKHKLQVDEKTNDIKILYQGEYRKWNDIRSRIRMNPNTYLLEGQYSRNGVIDRGFYEWTRLEPFQITEPYWGNRYILEICSWIVDEPRLGGDHTWVRFKTPRGEWYSFGQYRPQKMGFHEQFVFPMKIKVSKFMSPDISEFWRGPYTVVSFEITERQFIKMKRQVEWDQMHREHTYQLFHGNCTRYAKSIAEMANIHLPGSIPIIKLFVRSESVHSITRKVLSWKYTPKWLKPLLIRSWAVFFNTFGLLWGSGLVDKEVKGDPHYAFVKPYIKNFNDLIDTEKVITHHPFIIGHFVRKEIEQWRSEQQKLEHAKMQKDVERLNEIKNSLPGLGEKRHKELQEEQDRLKENILHYEKIIDDLRYACPPKFQCKVGERLKDNPWVRKTTAPDEEELTPPSWPLPFSLPSTPQDWQLNSGTSSPVAHLELPPPVFNGKVTQQTLSPSQEHKKEEYIIEGGDSGPQVVFSGKHGFGIVDEQTYRNSLKNPKRNKGLDNETLKL